MNPKNIKSNNARPILFFISLMVFLCMFTSFAWAAERDALILQARQTSWQGNYDEAITIYQRLIDENPKDIEAMLGLAAVLSWQKKYQESSAVYQKVRDLRPDLPDGELGLSRLKAWQGEHAAAEETLKALHSKFPERFDILMLLGQVTAWQKKYQESVDYYKKALAIHPENKEAIKALATTYKWMKNTKEGIKLYEKILEKDPNNIDALMGSGILYSQDGKNKEAIVYLEKAREVAPDRADVRAMLGTLYSWTAQLDDAVTELQKSVALEQGSVGNENQSRNNISNFLTLGRIFRWQKKKEESIKLYQKALEIDPNNGEAMVGLGRVYLYDDQWDKAEELYLKALTINPNDLDAKDALDQLNRIKAPEANLRYNFFESRLHDPSTGQLSSTFIDHRETIEAFFKLSPLTTVQARYQHAERRQLSLSNTTTDFNVNTETTSIGLNQKLPSDFSIRFRYDLSHFSNDNVANSASNLLESEKDYAGFFILTKKFDQHLLRAAVGRELFLDQNFGVTTIEDINTYSISYDAGFSDNFSTLVVLSLTDNSTFPKLQQDHAIRARYRLPHYTKIQFEYQLRYLSDPDTYQNSIGVNFQNQLGSNVRYEASYFVTQSHNTLDNFLRNSFKLFFSWDILPWLSWSTDAIVSLDHLNGDIDTIQNYQTYLTVRF